MKKPAMTLTPNDLAEIATVCEEKGVMFQVVMAPLVKRKKNKHEASEGRTSPTASAL